MGLAGIFIYYFGVKASFLFDFGLYIIGMILLTKLKAPEVIKVTSQNIFKMMKEV